ncbi:reverse transcriptase domain-containing protein [Oerskovia sp. Root22]|uniref:reverse transcriptase domain-containing protein n=1 Tax=Oerskovia sp. Root22 TaxID=1736494 RepID=UPI0021009C74|nr:reverse transcriptase domain-containing protein [Oerskovia sp. Root22]
MPRAGFGPRPINAVSATARTVYGALAEMLRSDLPPESRGKEKWGIFSKIGLDDEDERYVVELDMASCYEYVDHVKLQEEIILQSANAEAATALLALLGETFGRPRGLPQLMAASDLLSDAYLQGVERELLRSGYDVYRFADDFKVRASSWGEANEIIENAADISRDYGLVLSSAKTTIRRVDRFKAQRAEVDEFLLEYFAAARDDLNQIDVISNGYDDFQTSESFPDDDMAFEGALWKILEDWLNSPTETELPLHSHYIPMALSYLRKSERRISDNSLREIVFRNPIRLEAVLRYVLSRDEGSAGWGSLDVLASMERQSPWAKIWMLSAGSQMSAEGKGGIFADWAARQLSERHETVRAEAVWHLASAGSLTEDELRSAASSASEISRPSLAAAAGVLGLKGKFAGSLKHESMLSKQAFEWGESKK